MATCKVCDEPLLVPVDDSEDEGPSAGASSSSAAAAAAPQTVPDDLQLPCGCHYHWQCCLDQASHIALNLTCPSCDAHLVTNTAGPSVTNPVFHTSQTQPAIICRYESDGGVEDNYNILPTLTEEAYLESHPDERRPRAFLTMCGEGDVLGAVDLLKDAAADGEDVRAIVLYRDSLASGKSALHLAVEKGQEEAVWLLLYLASPKLPLDSFPQEALAVAQSMGLDRMPPRGGEDIATLRDDGGASAEDYAREMAGIWDRLVAAGVLRP